MNAIWNHCLAKLEHEMSGSDFSTWIRPLQAVEQNGQLHLLAPNQFVLDWVKRNYANKIAGVVDEFSNGSLQLQLNIGSKHSVIAAKNTKTENHVQPQTDTKKNSNDSLNKTFTFDTFVEGKSNQLARATALQVAENVSKAYNPLLIYGNSGLGKTHLMHAIGNAILEKQPNANIVYLRTEKFVQDMVRAIQQNDISKFKDYYRAIDVLLMDDIQFLAGKERSQEEFFHTFNALLDKKKQVILTCDRYPKEITGLEERLTSRFSSGLPVSIEPPDIDTRAAILQKKTALSGLKLSQDVAFFIAKRISSNVRDLEGALRRVLANAQFTGRSITIDFAKEALHDLISLQEKLINIEGIQNTVADYFKIRISDLLSKSRAQSITRPRQIAMTLARELTDHSLTEVGEAFGGRDHTTVMNACKKVRALKTSDSKTAEDYENLLRSLDQ